MDTKLAVGASALSLLVGLGAGWWLAESGPTEVVEAPPPEAEARPESKRLLRAPPAKVGCPPCEVAGVPADLPVELRDAYGLEGLAHDPEEGPLSWPEDLDSELRPENMEATLTELVEACGLGESLMGVDCDEPPCLAVLLRPEGEEAPGVDSCWGERFGSASTGMSMDVLCEDGQVYRMSLSGPYVEESHPPRDEDDPWKGIRRLDARQQSWGASLGCSEPAWVAVRNRLDHDLAWVPAE